MSDYTAPLRDLRFVLRHIAGLDDISRLEAFQHADPDTVFAALEECARFMSEVVAPTNRTGDQEGCHRDEAGNVVTPDAFKDAYKQFRTGGWGAVPFPPEFGGHGFPWLVGLAIQEMLTTANMAFSLCPMLTQGAIEALLAHGSDEQQHTYLEKLVTAEWAGTMVLTEPEAGSDLGLVRTKAVPAGDGTWRLSGTKIFITWGEHDLTENIIHLVLARIPGAAPGTKGLSMFVVPKVLVNSDGTLGDRNDVTCVSIEHKLGIHGSPTCVMSFGDDEGAVGYLVGEEQRGIHYMFTMMNNARLTVGLEGVGIAERAYQQALRHAQERRQGRAIGAPPGETSLIIEHPDVRRMLMTMKASIEAARALIYYTGAHTDLALHHADPDARRAAGEVVELLTPVAKAWPTDLGVELTSLGIQIHGGMGYVEETGAAQHYRDARIAPIYEGTNGIQAIDLVGRKLGLRGGEAVRELLGRMTALDGELAEDGEELATIRTGLADGVAALAEATAWLAAHGPENPNAALAGATPYLRMFGTVAGGWLLARAALVATRELAAGDDDGDFLTAKVATARFYAEQILPQARGLLPAVTSGVEGLFAIPVDHLGP